MASDHKLDHKWKAISSSSASKEPETHVGCFDCNICLDFANDPVVTLCGHLYCWPCIYKWFHIQSTTLAPDEYPQCPVCKSEISHTTVVPLYGRGQSNTEFKSSTSTATLDPSIPPRPPACGTRALLTAASHPSNQLRPYRRNPYQVHEPFGPPHGGPRVGAVPSSPLFNLTGNAVTSVFEPVVGMFGEMVYARVFGNSQNLYTYPNSYQAVGNNNSSRLRRQEMQVDKSLSRVSLFLLCGFLLCLFLF